MLRRLLFLAALLASPAFGQSAVPISALPTAATLTGTELVPVVQGGGTKQTTTGAIAGAPSSIMEAANKVNAGPASGSAAVPTYRLLVPADIPANIAGVPNNTALSALSSLLVTAVRNGYATAGDAPSLTYTATNVACALNSGAGDGGSQVPTSDGKCWNAVFSAAGADIREWGAVTGSGNSAATTTAIQAAFAYGEASQVQILIPCGSYYVSTLTVASTAPLVVHGAGQNCSKLFSNSTTANAVYGATGATLTLTDLTIDRSATPSAGAGLYIDDGSNDDLERITSQNQWVGFHLGETARGTCNSCVSQSNYSDCFYFTDNSTTVAIQWQLVSPLAQFCNGIGYNTYMQGTGGIDTGQVFINAGSFANAGGGFKFDGVTGSAINDLIMTGPYSSFDGSSGFQFNKIGVNNQITNPFAEGEGIAATGRGQTTPASHLGSGFDIAGTGVTYANMIVTGGVFAFNSGFGAAVESGAPIAKITFNGTRATGNGKYGNTSGFGLLSDTTIYLLTGVSASDNGAGLQTTGLYANDVTVLSHVYAAGADFSGNTSGGCNGAITGGKSSVLGTIC